jgi:hypothetical protein
VVYNINIQTFTLDFRETPFRVSPKGEKPLTQLLPLWGKVGKGVVAFNYILVYSRVLIPIYVNKLIFGLIVHEIPQFTLN